MIPPSQDPHLPHTCKVPFAMESNIFAGSGDSDVDILGVFVLFCLFFILMLAACHLFSTWCRAHSYRVSAGSCVTWVVKRGALSTLQGRMTERNRSPLPPSQICLWLSFG